MDLNLGERSTSKVRKTCNVIAKAGSLFEEIRSVTEHSAADDYVFLVNEDMLTQRLVNKCWRVLILLMRLPNCKDNDLTYSSLRHCGITVRFVISVKFIVMDPKEVDKMFNKLGIFERLFFKT